MIVLKVLYGGQDETEKKKKSLNFFTNPKEKKVIRPASLKYRL